MSATDPNIIPLILASERGKGAKINALFALAMINYRAPMGDQAFAAMNDLAGIDFVNSLMFLAGFCGALAVPQDRWAQFIQPELAAP